MRRLREGSKCPALLYLYHGERTNGPLPIDGPEGLHTRLGVNRSTARWAPEQIENVEKMLVEGLSEGGLGVDPVVDEMTHPETTITRKLANDQRQMLPINASDESDPAEVPCPCQDR